MTPKSYQQEIDEIKHSAAADNYQLGERYLENDSRDDANKAYNAFKKSGNRVNNYKDSKEKMEDAYNSSIVNLMINPITDNSFFFNTG